MMEFNVNDKVRVRLTHHGRDILRGIVADYRQKHPKANALFLFPQESDDGWSEWQLWELMSTFGEHCYNGCEVPFETTINIPDAAPSPLEDKPGAA